MITIAIEGLDASGKETQTKKLAERIGATRFTFPNYESPTGKAILGHLKNDWRCADECADSRCDQVFHESDGKLDALVFQCLQTTNRLEALPRIESALVAGPVVFDRYWASAVVYGTLDGLDRNWLMLTQADPMPPVDIWILLDMPLEESFKRRPERRDRYEKNREYLERVRLEYRRLFGIDDLEPINADWLLARPGWWIVDATGTIDEVHERIYRIVRGRLIERGLARKDVR